LSTIVCSNVIAGTAGTAIQVAGAPVNGTSAVDTLTIGGTPTEQAGSGFTLAFDGYPTALVLWSATNATFIANLDAALEALPSASNGAGGAFTTAVGTLTAGIGTVTITYTGNLAKLAKGPITVGVNSMAGTSPTVAVANTTPGVTATARGQAEGSLLNDITNGILYQNQGSALAPSWVKVGTES
jgi:hypothetical protein